MLPLRYLFGRLLALTSEPLVPSAPGGSGLRATQSSTICPLRRILTICFLFAGLCLEVAPVSPLADRLAEIAQRLGWRDEARKQIRDFGENLVRDPKSEPSRRPGYWIGESPKTKRTAIAPTVISGYAPSTE